MCILCVCFRVRRGRPAWSTFRPGTCSPRKSWSKKTTLCRSVSFLMSASSHVDFWRKWINTPHTHSHTCPSFAVKRVCSTVVKRNQTSGLGRRRVTDVEVKRVKFIKRTKQWHRYSRDVPRPDTGTRVQELDIDSHSVTLHKRSLNVALNVRILHMLS